MGGLKLDKLFGSTTSKVVAAIVVGLFASVAAYFNTPREQVYHAFDPVLQSDLQEQWDEKVADWLDAVPRPDVPTNGL